MKFVREEKEYPKGGLAGLLQVMSQAAEAAKAGYIKRHEGSGANELLLPAAFLESNQAALESMGIATVGAEDASLPTSRGQPIPGFKTVKPPGDWELHLGDDWRELVVQDVAGNRKLSICFDDVVPSVSVAGSRMGQPRAYSRRDPRAEVL